MPHWGKDILLSGRGLIACAAGLVVGQATNAGLISTPPQTAGPFYPHTKPDDTDSDLTRITGASAQASGEIIDITGRILSVKGHALRGAIALKRTLDHALPSGLSAEPPNGIRLAKEL